MASRSSVISRYFPESIRNNFSIKRSKMRYGFYYKDKMVYGVNLFREELKELQKAGYNRNRFEIEREFMAGLESALDEFTSTPMENMPLLLSLPSGNPDNMDLNYFLKSMANIFLEGRL
jgi:hypothetical protein